tara:strand:- start:256 stop:654 length:399 start_codon:yes stop_codon:yes gene_type:complete
MHFEYYNAILNNYYSLNQKINFEADMIIGNGMVPFTFNGDEDEMVPGLSISAAYPNPFNPATNIKYSISASGNVKILVYDITGRQVDVIYSEYKQSGNHAVVWNAENHPSGIYYIQVKANDDIQTQKVVLLK